MTQTGNRIPAGETVLVIKTPKGVYIRTNQGKIFAVRSAPVKAGVAAGQTGSGATTTTTTTSTATSGTGAAGAAATTTTTTQAVAMVGNKGKFDEKRWFVWFRASSIGMDDLCGSCTTVFDRSVSFWKMTGFLRVLSKNGCLCWRTWHMQFHEIYDWILIKISVKCIPYLLIAPRIYGSNSKIYFPNSL